MTEKIKLYHLPIFLLLLFEIIAIFLWWLSHSIFYFFNFTYIECCVALGLTLYIRQYAHARRVVQFSVGLYMFVFLGLMQHENMQIEGFWFYLFSGVFRAAVIHYAVAKILGPLLFGRG